LPYQSNGDHRDANNGITQNPGGMRAEHKTILAVDAEAFSGRENFYQVAVRDGIYKSVRAAFDKSGLPWDDCYHEDRGDGLFVLVSPDVPKNLFATPFPFELAAALREYNATCPEEAQIRLRVAVNAGELNRDSHGVAGQALNQTFRLLSANPLRKALAESPGNVALIASDWFYNEVIRNEPASAHRTYRRVRVAVKETRTVAWICLPDHPYPSRIRHRRKALVAMAGSLAVVCGAVVFRMSLHDGPPVGKPPDPPPPGAAVTTSSTIPPESGGPQPAPPPAGPGGPTAVPSVPGTPRPDPSRVPPTAAPPTAALPPSVPPPTSNVPEPSPSPSIQSGPGDPVQEERNVELSAAKGYEAVDIDWWRQKRDSSGDMQMDTGGVNALLGAGLAVVMDSPESTRDSCSSVRNWVTRVEFSSLHVGSQLCARSRSGRHAMVKINALPSSPASNGRLLFFGRTWEHAYRS
jgi:hypothetical protein